MKLILLIGLLCIFDHWLNTAPEVHYKDINEGRGVERANKNIYPYGGATSGHRNVMYGYNTKLPSTTGSSNIFIKENNNICRGYTNCLKKFPNMYKRRGNGNN